MHTHRHEARLPASLEEGLERAVTFHGHLGPYVVYGLRMGLLARRCLGYESHFDVKIRVYCGHRPPVSCMADGLQVACGATLGKGNIELRSVDDLPPRAVFECENRTIEVRLKPLAVELAQGLLGAEDVEAAGEEAARRRWDELFIKCVNEGGSSEG